MPLLILFMQPTEYEVGLGTIDQEADSFLQQDFFRIIASFLALKAQGHPY